MRSTCVISIRRQQYRVSSSPSRASLHTRAVETVPQSTRIASLRLWTELCMQQGPVGTRKADGHTQAELLAQLSSLCSDLRVC